jgi:hypothetical protein
MFHHEMHEDIIHFYSITTSGPKYKGQFGQQNRCICSNFGPDTSTFVDSTVFYI